MKRALIVAATGGFLNGFLIPDMKLLQEMGYEVHCAANGNSVSTFVPEERFASIGVTFHQIDFSSTSPISKESLTAYKQYKELLNRYHFDFVHVHTPMIFNRYANASATSKNSRIDSLCQNLGVSERRFSGDILEIQKDINYAEVKNNLNNLQQKTIEYLDAALSQ